MVSGMRSFVWGVPWLNAELDDYGAQVEIIDLRWGVDTTVAAEEEAKHDAELMTSLRAINRSHPPFVGLVSDRFVTPPDPGADRAGCRRCDADVEQSWRWRRGVGTACGAGAASRGRARRAPGAAGVGRAALPVTALEFRHGASTGGNRMRCSGCGR